MIFVIRLRISRMERAASSCITVFGRVARIPSKKVSALNYSGMIEALTA